MKKVNRYERRAAIKRLKQEKPFDTSLTITTEETVAALCLLLAIGIQEYKQQKGIDKCEYNLGAKTKEYSPSISLKLLS
jgi:hypothetical protein